MEDANEIVVIVTFEYPTTVGRVDLINETGIESFQVEFETTTNVTTTRVSYETVSAFLFHYNYSIVTSHCHVDFCAHL